MNKEETLKQICKMIASGEIPKQIYDKYLSDTPIGFMNSNDLFEYLENQELKKQLEEKTKIGISDHKYASKCEDKVITMENQQKEFIEYINKTIEELQCDDVDDEEMKGYLIQRIDTFKEILQKYKEIIGVSDEEIKN